MADFRTRLCQAPCHVCQAKQTHSTSQLCRQCAPPQPWASLMPTRRRQTQPLTPTRRNRLERRATATNQPTKLTRTLNSRRRTNHNQIRNRSRNRNQTNQPTTQLRTLDSVVTIAPIARTNVSPHCNPCKQPSKQQTTDTDHAVTAAPLAITNPVLTATKRAYRRLRAPSPNQPNNKPQTLTMPSLLRPRP